MGTISLPSGSISTNFNAISKTITPSGTTGDQTINTQAGSVNFASSATSLVVTNNLVTADSVIMLQIRTVDATMTSVIASMAVGSFTITPDVIPTDEVRVDFLVLN